MQAPQHQTEHPCANTGDWTLVFTEGPAGIGQYVWGKCWKMCCRKIFCLHRSQEESRQMRKWLVYSIYLCHTHTDISKGRGRLPGSLSFPALYSEFPPWRFKSNRLSPEFNVLLCTCLILMETHTVVCTSLLRIGPLIMQYKEMNVSTSTLKACSHYSLVTVCVSITQRSLGDFWERWGPEDAHSHTLNTATDEGYHLTQLTSSHISQNATSAVCGCSSKWLHYPDLTGGTLKSCATTAWQWQPRQIMKCMTLGHL